MGKTITTEEWIRKAISVHGKKYNYSKVKYINAKEDVCIICPKHGEFMQRPDNHIHGQGCPKCGRVEVVSSQTMTTKEFIERAEAVHGKKYDYSKVRYYNNHTDVCIICPKHGEFMQQPQVHLKGGGCPKCAGKNKTTEDFIAEAIKCHGKKYDYSKVEYKGSNEEVCIICPEHGEFWQRAIGHLRGAGCPTCGQLKRAESYSKSHSNFDKFVKQAIEKFGDKFDYSKAKDMYVNNNTPIEIVCPIHGSFKMSPRQHLQSALGCNKCNAEKRSLSQQRRGNSIFLERAEAAHGKKYDYSKVKYIKQSEKVCIICHEKDKYGVEHGEFMQTPYAHWSGQGCPKCGGRLVTNQEDFIRVSQAVHGDRYDYSKVKYVDSKTKVCIVCPEHGDFWILPQKHYERGQGCSQCNRPVYVLKENKLKYLKKYDVLNMSIHELLELISINALPNEYKKLAYSEASSEERKDSIKELQKLFDDSELSDEEMEHAIEHSIEDEEKKFEQEHSKSNSDDFASYMVSDTVVPKTVEEDVLPNVGENLESELLRYDQFSKQLVSYGEKNKFLSEVEIQKIWNEVLKEDDDNSKEFIKKLIKQRKTSSEWLSNIIDEFMKEYDRVLSIKADKDYKFKFAPKLMQKLMIYKLIENDSYLNLCGTGAGKTNAFLMASRAIGAKYSVIICPNGVKSSWRKAIKAIYPTIEVVDYEYVKDLKTIKAANSAYIIINYDKFSNGAMCTKDKMDKFIESIRPQFLCFDELHNAKAASDDASLRNENLRYFRQKANEIYGEGFKTLGMTATPLINNLNEVKSLLELVTGKEFKEIGNRNTIENIHLAYKNLLLYGFRFVPDYGINVVNTEINIDGGHLKDYLVNLSNNDVNSIEGHLVNEKMEAVKNDLTQGTIVYTSFIEKIVPKIEKKLKEFGITYARYTGSETAKERELILDAFAAKKFKVLVASSPITTGVDGLQEFCNKMILISLPWTNAEYTQLVGRINRQGSAFDEVNIIFPRVNIEIGEGKVWSWDNGRMSIINKKKTLSDAVVDGIFTNTANINKSKLVRDALEVLRTEDGTKDFETNREDITANPKIDETSREYTESIEIETRRRANIESTSTTHKRFTENRGEWYTYHDSRDRLRAEWGEDPQDVIAAKINESGAHGIIADMGCGRNELKGKITSYYDKWLSFDHVANDETVIEADTTNLSEYVADESLDVAVYCLSIWGRNKKDYFKEANRILKRGGVMYVAEPINKANQSLFLADAISIGFQLCEFTPERGRFTYFTYIKK